MKLYNSNRDLDTLREPRILRSNSNLKIVKAKSFFNENSLPCSYKNPKKFWSIIYDFIKNDIDSNISTVGFKDPTNGNIIDKDWGEFRRLSLKSLLCGYFIIEHSTRTYSTC